MPARAHLHQGLGDKTTLAFLFTLQETLRGGLELASQLSGGQSLIFISVVSLFHASRAVGLCSQWLMEFYLDSSFPSSLAGPSPSMPLESMGTYSRVPSLVQSIFSYLSLS